MAVEIVSKIKALNPPGRFLEPYSEGRWREVTKKQALEKASQAMREKKWSLERPSNKTTPPNKAAKEKLEGFNSERASTSPVQSSPATHFNAEESTNSQSKLSVMEGDAPLETKILHEGGDTNAPLYEATTHNPYFGAAQL